VKMDEHGLMVLCSVCGREIGDPKMDAEDFGSHGWETWVCMRCVGDQDRHPGDFVEEDFT